MLDEEDTLLTALSSDENFENLLRNGIFFDYFNTFLSLPIFARRLMYRKDRNAFEIDPPVKRTAHHLVKERIVTWVRMSRGPLFLKTSICNEYRLCAKLAEAAVVLRVDSFSVHELSALQKKYLSKVIEFQRFKCYLQQTIGENLVKFWLDLERLHRQVALECQRFAVREIYEKYMNSGSTHELNASLKERVLSAINSSQGSSPTEATLGKRCILECQNMVLKALVDYWIPKYVMHRLRRRSTAAQRWGKALVHESQNKERHHRPGVAGLLEIVGAMEKKDDVGENKSDSKPEKICSNPMSKESSDALEALVHRRRSKRYCSSSSGSDSEVHCQVYGQGSQRHDPARRSSGKAKSPISGRRAGSGGLDRGVQETESKLDMMRNTKICKSKSKSRRSSAEQTQEIRTHREQVKSPTKQTEGLHPEGLELTLSYYHPTSDEKVILPPIKKPYAADKEQKKQWSTLYEAIYSEKEAQSLQYEADDEEGVVASKALCRSASSRRNDAQDSALPSTPSRLSPRGKRNEAYYLPLIENINKASASFITNKIALSQSKISRARTPFSTAFLQRNAQRKTPYRGKYFDVLKAALSTDSMAGYPLVEYFKQKNNDTVVCNLKFWTFANQIMSDLHPYDTVARRRRFLALTNIYLLENSPRIVSLSRDERNELADALRRDTGVTRLLDCCDRIAEMLLPAWEEFLRSDDENFIKVATKRKRGDGRLGGLPAGLLFHDVADKETDDETIGSDELSSSDDTAKRDAWALFCGKRMWRAVELAVAICRPQQVAKVPDANEHEAWSTSDESEPEGSLNVHNLTLISKNAQRNHEKVKKLFDKSKVQGLGHDYSNTGYFQSSFQQPEDDSLFMQSVATESKLVGGKIVTKTRPPKPKCFPEVLNDSAHLEAFKKFLLKEHAELPLLFWQAVESMKIGSKTGKTRQGRTIGIMRRYFGPSSNYGRDLRCTADIIKDLPSIENPTPAMLISAQTCVARSLEDTWFNKYLQTYQDDGGITGVTLLPYYGPLGTDSDGSRSVKQKTRGLWRMFTRNVISFRRGLMNAETAKMFENFLKLQHQLNVAQFQQNGDMHAGSPRIIINNKLVYTEKLVADLNFWSEVERYKEFADAVVLCAKLGNYDKNDERVVVNKALTIVECFIDSQINPRVQINISNELADNILNLVNSNVIERGLFHEAALCTFSSLIHFWKKFCLHRFLPREQQPTLPAAPNRQNKSAQIALKERALRSNKIKRVTLPPDEDCPKILFSLQLGLRLAVNRGTRRRHKFEEVSDQFDCYNQLHTPTYSSTPLRE